MTTEPRKAIPRASAKRLAAEPDLRLRNSTVSRSPLQQTPRTRPKKVNVKRNKAERVRANGSAEYKAWLHAQPCAVCGSSGVPIQECHFVNGGMGRKADAQFTFPGCGPHYEFWGPVGHPVTVIVEGCHAELHRIGVQSFERKHKINLLDLAAKTWARWLAVSERANWRKT